MCSYLLPAELPADTPATLFIIHHNERSRWPQAVLHDTHVTRTEVTQRVYNVSESFWFLGGGGLIYRSLQVEIRYFYSLNLNSEETGGHIIWPKGEHSFRSPPPQRSDAR